MASTTVSIQGDKTYRDALSALARKKGKTMAEMVRDAVDARYGGELKPFLIFFAEGVADGKQSEPKGDKSRG
jgi:hypothetical protein